MIPALLWLVGALAAPPAPPTPAAAPEAAYAAALIERAEGAGLADDPQWWALLHYRQGTFGPYSEADGRGFFFAAEGHRDPHAELAATLRALFRPAVAPPRDPQAIPPPAQRHPQCNFPARFAWLNARLGFDPARLPRQPCPGYDRWRHALGATGATLVFADAYLNSPASMYGHTFLRLDQGRQGSPLLSYAVNFSAAAANTGGLLYAVLGLTGGFDGYYSTTPYYMKVQEYSNVESRDLWEYRLALAPAELERLVAHAWELGSTTFDYYFFDEN
ncbi:MAG: DUF4105 domain-containing protein, partial [Myxococcales bacterium]|nr:DUF4105 domain-containing protein [Myxococcales bacterium]